MGEQYRIGIIGTDNWGKKLIPFAVESGFDISILDKSANSGIQKNTFFVCGNPSEYEDVLKFGEQMDILKLGTDDINIAALKELQQNGVMIYPSPAILELVQDKALQKEFLMDHDLPFVTGWQITDNNTESDTENTADPKSNDLLSVQTWQNISADPNKQEIKILQQKPKREIHVTLSRNESGTIECYDPALMIMEQGKIFFDFDIFLPDIARDTAMLACELAAKVAEKLELKGFMIVELLLAANGKLYVNDLSIGPQKHRSVNRSCNGKNKSVLLMDLLLNPASLRSQPRSYIDELTIIEPVAYRKHIIDQSLKTILCTNDVHTLSHQQMKKVQSNRFININEEFIEEKLSKAIMIQHLLNTV